MEICRKIFKKFEIILDYYNTFYKTTKKEIINEINVKLNKLRETNIDEIIKLDKNNFIKNEFNLKNAIEETKNIKYKNTFFFMSIYREKISNESIIKSEDEIFNESKEVYKDILKRIINQKDSKEPFFEIEYIKLISISIENLFKIILWKAIY